MPRLGRRGPGYPGSMREGSTATITVTVNGLPQARSLDTRMSLLDLLREELGLTGSKKGATTASAERAPCCSTACA